MGKTYKVSFIEEVDGKSFDRSLLITNIEPSISPDDLKDYVKLLIFRKYTYSDYKTFTILNIEEIKKRVD